MVRSMSMGGTSMTLFIAHYMRALTMCACACYKISIIRGHVYTHRDGVITQNEAQDLSLLLARLGRIHVLFYHPHPLSKSQEGISPSPTVGVKEEKCLVSLEDFHFTFVQYCISNAFASLLYHYLDCYK